MSAPVLVAVPTYRRTELLPSLLEEIGKQAEGLSPPRPCRIALVDNDPAQSAKSIAAVAGAEYLAQPVPGIGPTRQRALEHAGPGELVVMIDDDLVPEPDWLSGLLGTWERHRPAVVLGFVRYVWPDGTDPWIAAGGFMRRIRYPDGTRLDHVATGNVLIDADVVQALGVAFEQGPGLTGGEDTRFGQQLIRAGGAVIASVGTVRDDIPVERTTRDFVRRRTIGHGQTRALLEIGDRLGAARQLARARALGGGIARWLVFTGSGVHATLRRDMPGSAVARRRAWFAIGRMKGVVGRRISEYARD